MRTSRLSARFTERSDPPGGGTPFEMTVKQNGTAIAPAGQINALNFVGETATVDGTNSHQANISPWASYLAIGAPLHWWKCNDAAGQSAIADSGSAPTALALNGVENADWILQAKSLYRGTGSLRLVQTNAYSTLATASITPIAANSDLTILVTTYAFPTAVENFLSLSHGATDLVQMTYRADGPHGIVNATGGTVQKNAFMEPQVVNSTFTVALRLYHASKMEIIIDGATNTDLMGSIAVVGNLSNTIDTMTLGNRADGTFGYEGSLGDVRVYTSLLTDAQLRSYAENARRM